MADEEDEGLSWDGGSDSTHVDSPELDTDAASDVEAAPTISSAMLVVYGVFGGIYLLYTVGWLIMAIRGTQSSGVALSDFMLHISTLLAIAAAPAWFISTLALTTQCKSWVRIVVFVVGVLVLIPWGFVKGVA